MQIHQIDWFIKYSSVAPTDSAHPFSSYTGMTNCGQKND